MDTKTIGLFVIISLLVTTPLTGGDFANIIYVDGDATGANDGSSWFNAFNYLQDALASAKPGCMIRVAQGIYYPDQSSLLQHPGGRISTFQLLSGVTLMGGYAGHGTPKPWERNVAQYDTILSGDLKRNDVLVNLDQPDTLLLDAPFRQDNVYSVVSAHGVDNKAILDGFTIIGGNANQADGTFPYATARGGGLFAYAGEPVIRNCNFKGNAAVGGGAGVYNYMTEASYDNCIIHGNYAAAEGGGMGNSSADPEVQNCSFINNRVFNQAEGGGMYNYDSDPTVHACIFTGNDGGYHGGGMYNAYSDTVATQCQFLANTAHKRGGGVYNATGSTPEFVDCVWMGNQASEWGGGMVNYYCAPTVINAIFQGNRAARGGGVYNRYSDPVFVNGLFSGNTSQQLGGAIGCHDADIQVINCTFWSNHAAQGRAIGCESATGPSSRSRVRISNSILWSPGNEIFNGDGSEITVQYSNIHGGWPGPGNIQANPLFVDPLGPDHLPGTDDDNLRLASGSPCIDAANNTAVPATATTDLDDNPRFLDDPFTPNTGHGIPPIVDMGPYEFQRNTQGGGDNRPVANAGVDQAVFARVNGQATVNLDGSGSYDSDGDPLQHFWHWMVEGAPQEAQTGNPQVQMPVGQHLVQLIVSDGSNLSDPDHTLITVTAALDGQTWMWPYEISRTSAEGYVNVYVSLVGIPQGAIDLDRSLTMYPGTLKAVYVHASETVDGVPTTTLFGMFDKFELVDNVAQNGPLTLTISGRLKSGQYFAGRDDVEIVP